MTKHNESALFSKKAKGFDALQTLIDRTLLPTAPVANRVWEKEDEGKDLVFMTSSSASPIGRLFDAVNNNVITVNGVKFSSLMSLWAYAVHTTSNGEVDDNLRTKYGSRLVKYITDNRGQNLVETTDLMHQWSIIVAGIATYITERAEDIKAAIDTHMEHHSMELEEVKNIEFVVPMSKSKFSRLYQEAVSYNWMNIVDYVYAVAAKEEKQTPAFSKRIQKWLHKFFKDEVLNKARVQNANAGVTDEWFTVKAFGDSIEGGKIVFHNHNSILSKLWIDGGTQALEQNYNDFLVAACMFRKHHAWQIFDFSQLQTLDNQRVLESAIQEGQAEQEETAKQYAKFTVADIAALIQSKEYKDFVFGVHSQVSQSSGNDLQPFKLPEISESFTEQHARVMRALCLFHKNNFKTRRFFDEDANKLLEGLWYSDIMFFATGPSGYVQPSVYGNRVPAFGNEVLTIGDITLMLTRSSMLTPGSEDDVKSHIDTLAAGRDQANEIEEQQKLENQPPVDHVVVLEDIVNSMIPQKLEGALTYKPKTFQKKEYGNKRNEGGYKNRR